MIRFVTRLWGDRRGNALLLMAGALPLVLGSAGLASDTIQWTLWKRQLQRAADSAAIAGVYARLQGQAVPGAVSTDLVKNNQTKIPLNAGFPQIAYPADTAQYNNGVQVSLAMQKRLGFSSLFMKSVPVIRANATAAAIQTGDYCVVSLESTNTTGILATGSTGVNLGCGMITNSISLDAAVAAGASTVVASPIAAVGGIDSSDNWGAGTTLLPFTLAQPDPFAGINPVFPAGNCANDPRPGPQANITLSPGCYKGLTLKGTVTLSPGEYYIDGGDINVNSGATVTGDGVVLILSNKSNATNAQIGNADFNGGAKITLKAPSSGTYKGIAVYQDRRAPDTNNATKINGNSTSTLQGAFYFPKQEIEFTGNAGMNISCVQLVVRRVKFSGSSSISNTCPPSSGAGSFKGRHVRLVG